MRTVVALVLLVAFAPVPDAWAQPECQPMEDIPGYQWGVDPNAQAERIDELIEARSQADVERLRKRLLRVFLGRDTLPTALPARVETVEDWQTVLTFSGLGIARIEKITIAMGEVQSIVHLFTPHRPSRQLVVYHSGHEGVVPAEAMSRFIQAGHTVAAVYMPIHGPNAATAPAFDMPGVGRTRVTNHEQFALMENKRINPLRWFVEPVFVLLNHLLRDPEAYELVAMIGLSGGGWTTTVAAAMDPRIDVSWAAAGSLPLHLRWTDWRSWGDYEQVHPRLLRAVGYLDIYLMAGSGEGRAHVQVLSRYDTCCFEMPSAPAYVTPLQRRVREVARGGEYRYVQENTHYLHRLSPCTVTLFLQDLAARRDR